MSRSLLEIEDLRIQFASKAYAIQAVRGVSFSLEAGETLALVGESGCGKSVLCRSILGLLPQRGHISGGEIRFEAENLAAMPEKRFREFRGTQIGMMLQNPASAFDPVMLIGAQLAEAARAHGKISREQAQARAQELLALVGIDTPELRARQYPHELSGGMLQRAALACALACGPKLLIADEPTASLDATVQAQILDLLLDLQKKTGISMLFVTHDLGAAARVAHRIAVLYAGKLVEIGTAEELFHDARHPYTRGLLASLPGGRNKSERLPFIEGMPPDLRRPPRGDAFAARNPDARNIDFEEEPPMFAVSETHFAATWLLHPDAPMQ